MSEVKLLDCTLRDGGYVNDWAFGYDNIVNIFERLITANLDIVEVGFLDNSRIMKAFINIMTPICRTTTTESHISSMSLG